ncbi:MAG: hypothetical protein ACLRUB_07595, partial [Streptococcus sp.]
ANKCWNDKPTNKPGFGISFTSYFTLFTISKYSLKTRYKARLKPKAKIGNTMTEPMAPKSIYLFYTRLRACSINKPLRDVLAKPNISVEK